MTIIDNIEAQAQSVTAAVCDNAALFGAAPERDEFDTREVWDENEAMDAVPRVLPHPQRGRRPDGTQLADERESLLWGFVNMLDSQTQRLDRAADKLTPQLRDLQREQDGTEIKSRELELVTARAQNLNDRRDAFETMRDAAADAYRSETGSTWRPRRGSHTSQTGKLTSAAIDARDFVRARKDRKTQAHLPQGTLVAIAGGKDIDNPAAVIAQLNKTRAKYEDMILVHGGGPGVEKIAANWADRNGVHQIVCKPDWDRHGRAAPFRRNEELLNLLPKGVIAFPGNGITENLVDRARQLGYSGSSLHRLTAKSLAGRVAVSPDDIRSRRRRGPFIFRSSASLRHAVLARASRRARDRSRVREFVHHRWRTRSPRRTPRSTSRPVSSTPRCAWRAPAPPAQARGSPFADAITVMNFVTDVAGIVLCTTAFVAVSVGDCRSDHMPMHSFAFTIAAIAHSPRQCWRTS